MVEEDVYLEVDDAEEWMHSAVLENGSGDGVIDVVETALDAVFTEWGEVTEEDIDESIRLNDGHAASELLAALLGNPGIVFDGMHEGFRTEKFERKVRQIGQDHEDRLKQLVPKALKVLKKLKEDEALKAMGILMGEKDDHVRAWLDAYSRLERNLATGRRRAAPSPRGELDQPESTTAAAAPDAPQNLAAGQRRAAPVPQGKSDQLDYMTAAAVRESPQKAESLAAGCGDGGTAVHKAVAKAIRLQLEEQYDEARQEWLAIVGMAGGKDDALAARAFYSAAYLIEKYDKAKVWEETKLREAISLYDKALDLMPGFAEALCGRGNARVAAMNLSKYPANDFDNDCSKAVDDYSKALSIQPDHVEALVGRGQVRTCMGHWKRAIRDFNKALGIKPDYVEALCSRGIASLQLNECEEAIEGFGRALSVKPDCAEALLGIGAAKIEMDVYEDALEYCDKALSVVPDYVDAFYYRALAKASMERLEDALEDCDKGLKIDPFYIPILNEKKALEKEIGKRSKSADKKAQKALMAATIKQCSERLQANPEKVGVLNERGMARAKLKLYDEALEDYDKALGIKPDFAEALFNRGRAKMKLGDYSGAVDDLEKALELEPRRKQAKRSLAKASAKLAKQRAKGKS